MANPPPSGSRSGRVEEVGRQVIEVPASPGRSATAMPMDATAPSSATLATPEIQVEMRKLIDAARSAIADLQASASQRAPQQAASTASVAPPGIPEPATTASAMEMQEEMRKLIDAARSAVADLRATVSRPPAHPRASRASVAPLGIPGAPTPASTIEMQEEMRKLIDAARAVVADLGGDDPAQGGASPGPKASKRRSSRRRT